MAKILNIHDYFNLKSNENEMAERIFTEDLFKEKNDIIDGDFEKEKVKIVKISETDKTKSTISLALIILYVVIGLAALLLV
ncbi:MAG: hypothetical protein IPH62_04535 [Ignavibacteriae bacterium]|nr:hypothetical protein [Ignavibacteriota bacterium]